MEAGKKVDVSVDSDTENGKVELVTVGREEIRFLRHTSDLIKIVGYLI